MTARRAPKPTARRDFVAELARIDDRLARAFADLLPESVSRVILVHHSDERHARALKSPGRVDERR